MAGTSIASDDGFRIADMLWRRIEPLLPARPPHPLRCRSATGVGSAAMDAIFFVLRTGCQWNALNATGICSSSSAHRPIPGSGPEPAYLSGSGSRGLLAYDQVRGIAWSPSALDTAMVKAPLSKPTPAPTPPTEPRTARNAVSW